MIIDSYKIDSQKVLNYDICIIGAGAAGITISEELSNSTVNVCLVESGNLQYSRETQKLYCGEIIGDRYHQLHLSRLRHYGGSTNHWGGGCIPLDDFDFLKRDWIPDSGWPVSLDDLRPYYLRAHNFLQIGEYNYNFNEQNSDNDVTGLYNNEIFSKFLKYSNLDVGKFGAFFLDLFKNSTNIDLVTNGNVTNLGIKKTGDIVGKITVKTLAKTHFYIKAKKYILASGGIENPRLLLISNDINKNGIGNQYDQVGRYFMDHLFIYSGILTIIDPGIKRKIDSIPIDNFNEKGFKELIAPDFSYIKNNHIGNCYSYLLKRSDFKLDKSYYLKANKSATLLMDEFVKLRLPIDAVSHLKVAVSDIDLLFRIFFRKLKDKINPNHQLVIRSSIEQLPDPDNRVILSEDTDMLGINKVNLQWKINENDKNTINMYHKYLEDKFKNSSKLNLQLFDQFIEDRFRYSYELGHHHSGTTRMCDDPKQGVVDKDCKVHGISNLYIAGSSVFPTVGSANPTLTILALAIRLSDHIKNNFRDKLD